MRGGARRRQNSYNPRPPRTKADRQIAQSAALGGGWALGVWRPGLFPDARSVFSPRSPFRPPSSQLPLGSLASRGHPMPETEPLEIQTEPLPPRRELADRKRCPSSPGSPGSRPAVVLGSRARRASHELVVAQEACDDDAREPPLLPPPSRMEQARDDLLRFMERPCWARLVGRTGLEPQTTRPQAGLLLTRVSLASDRRSCTCSGSSATAPCSSSY